MTLRERPVLACLLVALLLSTAAPDAQVPPTLADRAASHALFGVTAEELLEAVEGAAERGDHPLCVGAATDPDGSGRYSAAWGSGGSVTASALDLDLSEAELTTALTEREDAGYRVLDIAPRVVENSPRFSVVWVTEEPARQVRVRSRLTRQDLETELYRNAQDGYGPVRIRSFRLNDAVWYAAAWVQDRLGYRVGLDLTELEYEESARRNALDDQAPVDVSSSGLPGRFFGLWVSDPSMLDAAYALNLTEEEIAQHDRVHTDRGLALAGIELDFTGSREGRYHATWRSRDSSAETP